MKKITHRLKIPILMAVLAALGSYSTSAGIIVLDFEGLGDMEPILNYYDGGLGGNGSGPGPAFGIAFSGPTLAIIDADAGGSGNFGGEPSPSTIMFFLDSNQAIMNVAAGFTTGFSFYYTSINFSGQVTVWDGLNGTGNLLATIPLPVTPYNGAPDPTGLFSPLVPVGVSFEGTAKSINFAGTANQIGFDDITFGSQIPGGERKKRLSVQKFYDRNANGIRDDGEPWLTDWLVGVTDYWKSETYGLARPATYLGLGLTPATFNLLPAAYLVIERTPSEPNWIPTTQTPVYVNLQESAQVNLGNVCVGPDGARPLSFWASGSGQALIGRDDRNLLNGLNLRAGNGLAFDFLVNPQLRLWLVNASGPNMAYPLSAQLACMALNVFNGFVNGDLWIYAPATASANVAGFASVNAILAEANNLLGAYGNIPYDETPLGNKARALVDALEKANNNLTFLQLNPCPFTFNDDTDGDGVSDVNEIKGGTNPLDPASKPAPTSASSKGSRYGFRSSPVAMPVLCIKRP